LITTLLITKWENNKKNNKIKYWYKDKIEKKIINDVRSNKDKTLLYTKVTRT